MELIRNQMQSSHRGILDLDSGRVLIGVERSAHTQALRGGGAGDQVDDDLVAFERASAPVAGDVTEPESQGCDAFRRYRMNMRCSILFHLLVPGGKWQTLIFSPVASAMR